MFARSHVRAFAVFMFAVSMFDFDDFVNFSEFHGFANFEYFSVHFLIKLNV